MRTDSDCIRTTWYSLLIALHHFNRRSGTSSLERSRSSSRDRSRDQKLRSCSWSCLVLLVRDGSLTVRSWSRRGFNPRSSSGFKRKAYALNCSVILLLCISLMETLFRSAIVGHSLVVVSRIWYFSFTRHWRWWPSFSVDWLVIVNIKCIAQYHEAALLRRVLVHSDGSRRLSSNEFQAIGSPTAKARRPILRNSKKMQTDRSQMPKLLYLWMKVAELSCATWTARSPVRTTRAQWRPASRVAGWFTYRPDETWTCVSPCWHLAN